MDNKQKMIELALSYLKKGWSVIPCHKSKIPAIPWRDFQTRYATPEEVVSWYETNPDAQVGIVTGKISNLTVVDVEDHGDPSFLPQETMIVHTGGNGYHYFFKYEPGVTNKARIKELVDIRSEGGYVVAPGSCSEKGAYVILQDVPLLSFPKELFPEKVDIFQYPGITAKGFTKKELDYYPGYGKGQRNDEMARYIGYILTQIHPADWDTEGWDITLKANQKNTPPLTPNELRNTFESIKRTERRKNPLGRSMTLLEPSRGMPEEDDITVLGDENDEVIHLAEAAALQELDDSQTFPLDMPCFDEAIGGGINIGDVIAIAGQTGHGKTTLAQDWTLSLLKGEGKLKPLWFSYEVLATHLWKKFKEMGATKEDFIFIPAKHSTGNVAWVEKKIQEGKKKYGITTVFIDHLGFLLPKTNGILGKNMSSNYSSFLTQIMRDLKTIALKEKVIIVLPVHMKKVDSRNRNADVDDIKDTSGVGQESDLVFLIEREREKDPLAKTYFTDITRITLAKNRKTGLTVVGKFNMLHGRFAYSEINKVEEVTLSNYEKISTSMLPYENDED